jgi:hypothetical protein
MTSYQGMRYVIESSGTTDEWISHAHLMKILMDSGMKQALAKLRIQTALHGQIEPRVEAGVTYYRVTIGHE